MEVSLGPLRPRLRYRGRHRNSGCGRISARFCHQPEQPGERRDLMTSGCRSSPRTTWGTSQEGILSSIMYLMTNHLTGDAPVMRTA